MHFYLIISYNFNADRGSCETLLYWGFFGHQRGIPSESIDNEAPLPEKNDSEAQPEV